MSTPGTDAAENLLLLSKAPIEVTIITAFILFKQPPARSMLRSINVVSGFSGRTA
jgi:hypothetical protein